MKKKRVRTFTSSKKPKQTRLCILISLIQRNVIPDATK